MTRERLLLIALLCMIAAAAGGFVFGRQVEASAQQARAADKTIGELDALLNANRQLIQDSQSASRQMREALNQRAAHDQKSTRKFRDALSKTARSRADCRFDAELMQHLQAARERAAAAAASGIRGAVPVATDTSER